MQTKRQKIFSKKSFFLKNDFVENNLQRKIILHRKKRNINHFFFVILQKILIISLKKMDLHYQALIILLNSFNGPTLPGVRRRRILSVTNEREIQLGDIARLFLEREALNFLERVCVFS
jgi:hypothetical protein